MKSFFDLPHIFVVFHPGSGGNFVSGIINKIISQDFSTLLINCNGSSHTVVNAPMSFGITCDERLFFKNRKDQEQYYLTEIKNKFSNSTNVMISWTHDFSNIEFYRKHFKNCKILCITTDSKKEIISCMFMNVTKMMINNPNSWAVTDSIRIFRADRLEKWCKHVLITTLKYHSYDVDNIYKSRGLPVQLVMAKLLLSQYKLINYIDGFENGEQHTFNSIVYPASLNVLNPQYIVGPTINTFVDLADAQLPYSFLCTRNYNKLIQVIEIVIGRSLTNYEIMFVNSSCINYVNAQTSLILSNPIEYYQTLKKNVEEQNN